MTTPTPEQLHHLANRARDGVALDAEHDQLAAGITAMADRLDRANKAIRFMLGWESAAHVAELEQRAARAEAAIERVRQLHNDDDFDSCRVCETRSTPLAWPCPTIRALDQAHQPTTPDRR